jgi:hypothetical protein
MGRYDDRRKVWVIPFNGSPIKYGFLTNIDTAQSQQLGHGNVTGQALQGLVMGANSPKPARASRRFATGTVTSFINAGNVANALTQGWKLTKKAQVRRGSNTAKSQTCVVTLRGVSYAWQMPKETAQKIGSLAALGIRLATPNDVDLVFGASEPKPPRATQTIGDDTISTFYDPSTQLPAGWAAVAQGVDPIQGPA